MTFLLALLVLSVIAMVLTVRSALHDDRGATPPPRSHTSGDRVPSSR
jgi:hypothetical protein